MKCSSLFSLLSFACLAVLGAQVLAVPAGAGVPAEHVRIYTERIDPAPAFEPSVDTAKKFTDRLVFSSFTASTSSRLDVAADRSRCPAFLIGADPSQNPLYRALAVPWCRSPR